MFTNKDTSSQIFYRAWGFPLSIYGADFPGVKSLYAVQQRTLKHIFDSNERDMTALSLQQDTDL
jgi:hypothetical protein